MHRLRSLLPFLLVAVLVPLPASAAGADPQEAARALAETAYGLAKAGRYDDAIDLYHKAYDLSKMPIMLYNVARLCEKKKDRRCAIEHYRKFLDVEADPELRAPAEKALDEAIAATPGRIEVIADVAGARVEVDDRYVGLSPVPPIVAPAGSHRILVRLKGYTDFVTTVVVEPDEATRVDASLVASVVQPETRLAVRYPVPDCVVRVDGRVVGTTPISEPFPIEPGRHVVLVLSGVEEMARAEVEVGPGQLAQVILSPPKPAPSKPVEKAWQPLGQAPLHAADTIPKGRLGLSTLVGYPSVDVKLLVGAGPAFDVGPRIAFFYGHGANFPVLGMDFGATLRMRAVTSGGFSLAFVLDPGLSYGFPHDGPTTLSLRIVAPWVVAAYRFDSGITLMGGLKTPVELVVVPKVSALIPILFHLGVEFPIQPGYGLTILVDLGPEVFSSSGGSVLKFHPAARTGVGFLF